MNTLYLYVGLHSGLMLRSMVDNVEGVLSDTRTRFLGGRSVQLVSITLRGSPAALAFSTQPWLSHVHQNRNRMVPISYDALEYGSSFSSEACPEGIVAISGNTLRILTIDNLDSVLNQASIPLKYTPRRLVLNSSSNHFVVIETEHAYYGTPELKRRLREWGIEDEEELEQCILPPEQFGHVRSVPGKWASCIRVVNPFTGDTTQLLELEHNEAAFSLLTTQFDQCPGEEFVLVGTGVDVTLTPHNCSSAFIQVYKWVENGTNLELLYKTQVEGIPQVLAPFKGRLLVGIGSTLRLYELGKKKLLRKAQSKDFPNLITRIHTMPDSDRILVADVKESIFYIMFRPSTLQFHIFADDTTPRYVTSSTLLDYNTVAGGDKFGNLFIIRLPLEISQELDNDPTGNKLVHARPKNNGAPFKLKDVVNFHVGDIITSIQKTTLVAGGREILLYSTMLGGIYAAIPLTSKADIEFFRNLEMHMRTEKPSLMGRDHLLYRSAFVPIKACTDGDLCEQYTLLSSIRKEVIASELERTAAEVTKKLEDMRTMFAF